MNISEKKRNIIFWVLQFLGWGFINLLSIFIIKKVSLELVIYSIIAGMFIGIFSTSLLRWYLKRKVQFNDFGLNEILKIAMSFLVTSALFAAMNYSFGYLYAHYGPSFTEEELQFFKNYDGFWIQAFNALFLIGAWLVTYLVIKLLLKLNKDRIERLQLNTSLKQAQLNTLKGQINPHFMFNSLNNIRGLMLEDVEKSREMLTKLSEMLRYSLTKNSMNGIAVGEELEMVDNYIALAKIQFEKRLEFVKNIDPEVLELQIPPMIIQLLVENAAKHGISNLRDGGKIHLNIQSGNDELEIVVSNTGKLQISKGSTQLGLNNIRQRLNLLYGDRASFDLNEKDGEVVATIKIPLS